MLRASVPTWTGELDGSAGGVYFDAHAHGFLLDYGHDDVSLLLPDGRQAGALPWL